MALTLIAARRRGTPQSAGGHRSRTEKCLVLHPEASLDDGGLRPASYAVTEPSGEAEKAITGLVRKAVGRHHAGLTAPGG